MALLSKRLYNDWKEQLSKKDTLVNAQLPKGFIATPFPLIEEIVDKLPIELDNQSLKVVDIACGRGAFLFVLKQRFMEAGIPEQIVVENILCGVDIDPKAVAFTKAVINPENKYKDNIVCANALEWGDNNKMKFDVVVGNPPYQDDTSVNTKNLWPKFVDLATTLVVDGGTFAMITPRTWTTNEMYKRVFTANQPIALNVDECAKHFPGVGSTFSYFVVQNKQNDGSEVEVTLADGITQSIQLPSGGLGVRSGVALNVIGKVTTGDYYNVITSSGYNTMKFSKNDPSVSWTKDDKHQYPVLHKRLKKEGDVFFYSSHLDKTTYGIPRVVVGLWVANYRDMWVSTELLTCEQFRHFPVSTIEEAEVLRSVLQSKLYTFIAKNMVSGGSFTTQSMSFFPKVDLMRSWTDEELYKHFKLTKEEIELVEDTTK